MPIPIMKCVFSRLQYIYPLYTKKVYPFYPRKLSFNYEPHHSTQIKVHTVFCTTLESGKRRVDTLVSTEKRERGVVETCRQDPWSPSGKGDVLVIFDPSCHLGKWRSPVISDIQISVFS